MSDYFNRVQNEEVEEPTIENIPDDVLKSAIETSVLYGECPHCEEQKFYTFCAGRNSSVECSGCEKLITVVG